MTTPTKQALKHLVVVFFYSAVSAILPILIAYAQNDPRWALLIPVINAAWYSITRYLKEQKLIENDIARGEE
ncbi:MAG: hypothetical protein UV82_C0007G0013 [Candidatus Magasanikbacteria bacterium GW2011_GWD2_43_18]|nr:MAG: hypothetical protein UV18_C0009G0019 [Candidatus Magasanikbacteria bacterium GW2011_GWC2_42_27]KKT04513.1 MAG: hypothetical protein UV82_C0007G0013 [Candidatus Magasanikbacteria bacterium GW2011_GWD2_43_18]HCC13211.1 hypothetical protein [Candidatus Magasanikbacteria bacterium]